jgi:hypothetical protein
MNYKIWYACEAEKVECIYQLIFAASKKEAEKDFRERYNLTQGEYVTVKMLTTNSEEKEE